MILPTTTCNKIQYLEIKDTSLKFQDSAEEDLLAMEFLRELSQLLPKTKIDTDFARGN